MQMGAKSFKLQMRVDDKSRFGAGWLMARAAELSDLVQNESKRLTEKKQMNQNLQQKDTSEPQLRIPSLIFLFLFVFFFRFYELVHVCCCL